MSNGYIPRAAVSDTANYLSKREDIIRLNQMVGEACEKFLTSYAGFLNGQEKCRAQSLIWGIRSVKEYYNKLLVQVLMASYNVWDESHLRYPVLLDVVKENNPDWVERIVKNHDEKLKKCKVSVYPLEEALTA